MSKIETVEDLDLQMHIGTVETYYDPTMKGMYWSEGFSDLLQQAECVWLLTDFLWLIIKPLWIDLQATRYGDIFVFRIDRRPDGETEMTFMDGNLNTLWDITIGFSTFPIGIYEFYISNYNGQKDELLLFLKSEY